MKVAIIGAGLSGLACAHELNRNGIKVDIFEKKDYIGSHVSHAASTLKLFDKTFSDPLKRLRRKYHMKLSPVFQLEEVIMLSPSNQTSIRGNLGYVFLRGMDESSLENQLAARLSQPVIFNRTAEVFDLRTVYDYVVVASGDCTIAKELNIWTTTMNTYVRMATVIGEFRTGVVKMWFNTEYSKNCYCYMIANTPREAVLILTADNTSAADMDYYWKAFLTIEEMNHTVTETLDFEYNLGYADSVRFDNIYFIGNAAGFTDDLIGLGVFNSLESGALAARAIACNEDYTTLVEPLWQNLRNCHEFRKTISSFDNNDYDKLLAFLELPGIKQFIYKSPLSRLKEYAPLARIHNRLR